ncbi:MAG: hypothetical protein PHT87_07930 [Bacteroidales bacterium]|nr:hypothetical protein [Bacteroidales bacterium]MDD4641264.1 hypothetical protein [Bacteroidales bacterium]
MENTTFFVTYLVSFFVCTGITLGLIALINKSLKTYFEHLSQEAQVAKLFNRMTKIVILLAGMGAALTANYTTGEKADWLSLTWNVAAQVKESLESLFIAFLILSLAFLVLHVCTRKCTK